MLKLTKSVIYHVYVNSETAKVSVSEKAFEQSQNQIEIPLLFDAREDLHSSKLVLTYKKNDDQISLYYIDSDQQAHLELRDNRIELPFFAVDIKNTLYAFHSTVDDDNQLTLELLATQNENIEKFFKRAQKRNQAIKLFATKVVEKKEEFVVVGELQSDAVTTTPEIQLSANAQCIYETIHSNCRKTFDEKTMRPGQQAYIDLITQIKALNATDAVALHYKLAKEHEVYRQCWFSAKDSEGQKINWNTWRDIFKLIRQTTRDKMHAEYLKEGVNFTKAPDNIVLSQYFEGLAIQRNPVFGFSGSWTPVHFSRVRNPKTRNQEEKYFDTTLKDVRKSSSQMIR